MFKTSIAWVAIFLASVLAGCAYAPTANEVVSAPHPEAPRQRYAVIGTNGSYHAPDAAEVDPAVAQLQQMVAVLNERLRYLERLKRTTSEEEISDSKAMEAAGEPINTPAAAVDNEPAELPGELPELGAQPARRAPAQEVRIPRAVDGFIKASRRIAQPRTALPTTSETEPRTRTDTTAPRGRHSINQLVLPSSSVEARSSAFSMKVSYQPPSGFRPISAPTDQEWLVIYRFRDHAAGERFAQALQKASVTLERKLMVNGEYVLQVGRYREEERARLRRAFLGEHTGVLPELRVR